MLVSDCELSIHPWSLRRVRYDAPSLYARAPRFSTQKSAASFRRVPKECIGPGLRRNGGYPLPKPRFPCCYGTRTDSALPFSNILKVTTLTGDALIETFTFIGAS